MRRSQGTETARRSDGVVVAGSAPHLNRRPNRSHSSNRSGHVSTGNPRCLSAQGSESQVVIRRHCDEGGRRPSGYDKGAHEVIHVGIEGGDETWPHAVGRDHCQRERKHGAGTEADHANRRDRHRRPAGWYYLRAPVRWHSTWAAWLMVLLLGMFIVADVLSGQYGHGDVRVGLCGGPVSATTALRVSQMDARAYNARPFLVRSLTTVLPCRTLRTPKWKMR